MQLPILTQPIQPTDLQRFAERIPNLIRTQVQENIANADGKIGMIKIASITFGGVLAGASFTKHIPGKWKIASGLTAAASLGMGMFTSMVQGQMHQAKDIWLVIADMMEQDPSFRKMLVETVFSGLPPEIAAQGMNPEMEKKIVNNLLAEPLSKIFPQGLAGLQNSTGFAR